MTRYGTGFFERRGLDRSRRRWANLAKRAGTLSPEELRALSREARLLRRQLELVSIAAQEKLVGLPAGMDGIARPDQCDWAWRPDPWARPMVPQGVVGVPSPFPLTDDVKLFHDCTRSELTLRQIRNTRPDVSAPFAVSMEVYVFDGSFLSLVLDFPESAVEGLTLNHVIAVAVRIEREHPLEIFARLNVQYGPNTEQMVRQMKVDGEQGLVELDLAYSGINEKRIEKIWMDLIFEGPQMNQVVLRDMTVTRAPRADL